MIITLKSTIEDWSSQVTQQMHTHVLVWHTDITKIIPQGLDENIMQCKSATMARLTSKGMIQVQTQYQAKKNLENMVAHKMR